MAQAHEPDSSKKYIPNNKLICCLPAGGKIPPILNHIQTTRSPLTLIIDGHNLAFYLYNLRPGQRLSQKIAQMLVDHLSAYQNAFRTAIPQIELCFDGGVRPATADPVMMRILASGPHNKADYLVLDRFRFHAFSDRPCLVITNDGEIQEKIEQEGGSYLNVFDFVLLPHLITPVFLPPKDLPIYKPGQKNQAKQKQNPDVNEGALGDTVSQNVVKSRQPTFLYRTHC